MCEKLAESDEVKGDCRSGGECEIGVPCGPISRVDTEVLLSLKFPPVEAVVLSPLPQVSPELGILRAISSRIASGEKTWEKVSSCASNASSSSNSGRMRLAGVCDVAGVEDMMCRRGVYANSA